MSPSFPLRFPAWALAAICLGLVAGCGGGGSGGDDGGGGPPGPAFADTFETGLAVAAGFQNAAVVLPRILVPVSEAEMGADLNGDGDTLDDVVHEVETTTNTNRNLGLAVIGPVLASDRHFAFLVSEGAQGGGDLNGDGDASDAVWHVFNPTVPLGAANPRNLGLATPATGLMGVGVRGGFFLLQSEAAQGADLNADGDQTDTVGAAFDGATFIVNGTTQPIAPATPLPARNSRVAFTLDEAAAGADLSQDGDATDLVIGFADFTQSPPTIGRPAAPGGRAIANLPYGLTDDALVYFIDENTNGAADLNLDGDATDAVLAVFDLAALTGETTPANGALLPTIALAVSPAIGLATGRHHVLVGVSEAGNAQNDLNGDGDTFDSIIGWVDTRAGQIGQLNVDATLPLGPFPMRIDGDRGVFGVSENARGAFEVRDLNGDGDEVDVVAFVVDTTTNTFTNLGLAAMQVVLDNDDLLLGISEAAQGGVDRNGDGQADDIVESYINLGDPSLTENRLGFSRIAIQLFRLTPTEVRIAGLFAEGSSANFGDLNQDGDLLDRGVELVVLNPLANPAGPIAPTPFFAGTASLGNDRPLSVGQDVYAFPCAEISVNQDLNGDGDSFDTVLHFVRIR